MSNIEWTDATWNPIVGCSRKSAGCLRCYAERAAYRLEHALKMPQYQGTTKKVGDEIRWTGKVNLVESKLPEPLRWRKPRMVFVNSMSDLFHESVPDEWIAAIFGVMAVSRQHVFQVLTKRPERMREWCQVKRGGDTFNLLSCLGAAARALPEHRQLFSDRLRGEYAWPLPNVWLGTSVEGQETAEGRIPALLDTPATVRFVSYEPALAPARFDVLRLDETSSLDALTGTRSYAGRGGRGGSEHDTGRAIDWLICGGESGPGARPFDVQWARDTVEQCHETDTDCFIKQLGSNPRADQAQPDIWPAGTAFRDDGQPLRRVIVGSKKGGEPSQWPESLRVREMPGVSAPVSPTGAR